MDYALPCSGGFDSTVSFLLLRSHTIFAYFVDYQQPYVAKEYEAYKKLSERYDFKPFSFYVNYLDNALDNLPTVDNPTVVGRNLLLLMLGLPHSNKLVVSAPDGDMHPWSLDKNPFFFEQASSLFSYLKGSKVEVLNFLGHKTKTEWVTYLIANYGRDEAVWILENTVSCYGEGERCGKCKPCWRKWISAVNNEIELDFSSPPWLSEVAQIDKVRFQIALDSKDFSRISPGKIKETFNALEKIK